MSAPLLSRGTVRTARLLLRRPQADDAAAIAAALSDHEVARMLARVPQPYHLQDARDWLASLPDRQHDDHIALVRTGDLIGMIGLHNGDGDTPRLGYWLNRSNWGFGFATEALAAMLRLRFSSASAPISSGVFSDNAASLRLQEKLGFRVVGRSEVFSLARNCMVDHIETELTAADFHRLSEDRVTSGLKATA